MVRIRSLELSALAAARQQEPSVAPTEPAPAVAPKHLAGQPKPSKHQPPKSKLKPITELKAVQSPPSPSGTRPAATQSRAASRPVEKAVASPPLPLPSTTSDEPPPRAINTPSQGAAAALHDARSARANQGEKPAHQAGQSASQASLGSICTTMIKPEMPATEASFNAWISVQYQIDGGKIKKVELIAEKYSSPVDKRTRQAFFDAIKNAAEKYVCNGNHLGVRQDFSFSIKEGDF
jgi:hypothetical protein